MNSGSALVDCHARDTGADIFWSVNYLITNISHCAYRWSCRRYYFEYSIKRKLKFILITERRRKCGHKYIQPCGEATTQMRQAPDILWLVRGLIMIISHCDYRWSCGRYLYVYSVKRKAKLFLISWKSPKCGVMSRRERLSGRGSWRPTYYGLWMA